MYKDESGPALNMTKREEFARAALCEILSSGKFHLEANENAKRVAKNAFLYADAMIEEGKKDA